MFVLIVLGKETVSCSVAYGLVASILGGRGLIA